jgi:hypothetical protein
MTFGISDLNPWQKDEISQRVTAFITLAVVSSGSMLISEPEAIFPVFHILHGQCIQVPIVCQLTSHYQVGRADHIQNGRSTDKALLHCPKKKLAPVDHSLYDFVNKSDT